MKNEKLSEIEKLGLLYGKLDEKQAAAFPRLNKELGLVIEDEQTAEFSHEMDIEKLFNEVDKNKKQNNMGVAKNRKEVTQDTQTANNRTEVKIESVPFFKFETVNETFKGKILDRYTVNLGQGQKAETFICEDDLGEKCLMPTNVQLLIKLGIAFDNAPSHPVNVEVVFTGTMQTAKGKAKQFLVYTID